MIVVFRAVILLIAFAYGALFATVAAWFVIGVVGMFGVIGDQTMAQLAPLLWVIGPVSWSSMSRSITSRRWGAGGCA